MTDVTRRSAMQVAVAGLAALSARPLLAEDAPVEDGPKDMWRAWSTTSGEEKTLTVEGIYQEGGPGLVAVLRPAEPQGINPKILLMELKIRQLPGAWTLNLIPIPASWTKSDYEAGQYESVSIRYPDGAMVQIERIFNADEETP